MSTLADLLVKIGVDASDLESGMDSAAGFVDRNFGKITAAGVAAGAGMEAFARKQAPATEGARKLAASTGMLESDMRDLIRETSNVTFPLDDVIGTMEAGRQQGLKTGEELQKFATFWDMVGDATGESAVALADSGVALRAVGIAAGDEAEALGAFGFVSQETTQDIGEFLTFLERTGPELNEMGAGVDEAAAILGVMEDQFGMTGRVARTEFRKAVSEADGDMGKMLDTLGVSGEQFDTYMGKVAESSGVIERNAAIHAESFTPMQKLQHAAEELMFRFGGLGEAASMMALPLMALGPASKLVTGGLGAMTKFAGVAGKAFLGLSKILLANPWVLVAAAIIALVVVVVKNWHTIVAVIRKAWDWITARFRQATDWLKRTWDSMWGAVRRVAGSAVAFVRGIPGKILAALSGFASSVASFISRWHPAAVLYRMIREGLPRVTGFVRGIPGKILSALGNMGSLLTGAGRALLRGLVNGIKSMASAPVDAVKNVASRIRRLLPFSEPKDPSSPLRGLGKSGAALVDMIAGGMASEVGALARQADAVARAALPALGVPSFASGQVPDMSPAVGRMGAVAAGGGTVEIHNVVELDGRVVYEDVKRRAVADSRRNVTSGLG